jgi:hypothetical protein
MKIKSRRAWNGKLSRIDNFLQRTYESMTKTDQNKKDTAFRRYYRYYNDGDFPRGLRYSDGQYVTSYQLDERIEEALEQNVNKVIGHLLKKYWRTS